MGVYRRKRFTNCMVPEIILHLENLDLHVCGYLPEKKGLRMSAFPEFKKK
jgi:hypothetical protein